jgi:YidC/Oxa1 family membrane protein insertase
MDQKRLVAFIVLSMAILIGWSLVFAPKQPVKQNVAAKQNPPDEEDRKKPAEDDQPAEVVDDPAVKNEPVVDRVDDAAKPAEAVAPPEVAKKPEFPLKTIVLGSRDPLSEYRQSVKLTTLGAAVEEIELNDPKFRTLTKPNPPLVIVSSEPGEISPLALRIPQINADVRELNWELIDVAPAEAPHHTARFRFTAGDLEMVKQYTLTRIDPQAARPIVSAYELRVDLTFKNLAPKPRIVNYELQGPFGVPLENEDNTQHFRDIVVGFVADKGAVTHQSITGAAIAEAIANGKGEEWQKAFDYIGVNVQYFTALLMPREDQRTAPYIRSAVQQIVGPNLKEKSDVSVLLTSVDLDLEKAGHADGKDSVTHGYTLFAGPKRDDLLPEGTEKVIDFGTFHWISRPMLSLLKGFYNLFGNWGIAIICLTIVVRSALLPLSIRQARGAAKMQELQPELAALKEKYGKDKEKFARAQMELFSKHNYNPLAGCLPIFLQLPVFMGLYNALNHSVDLRMAKFLWVQNLAAPDALFPLPFVVPFFGWKEFNLLPLITVALYLVQQKMFMPPPANEEQAMQQKMMNFMMVFIGVMFYKVPAGLCVYFIASTLWGLAERKLLPKAKAATPPAAGADSGDRRRPPDSGNDNGNNGGGIMARLLKAAEKETSMRNVPGKRR